MNHIVALSGGKDSTALALRLVEVEPRDYVYVCTPTGDELPEMFEHWNLLGKLLNKPLLPVTCGESLDGAIRRQNALPNWRQRWCTRILKIEPYLQWCATQTPCVSYVGLRADEESRPGIIAQVPGVEMRFPLKEWGWGLKEVMGYLDERGVSIPRRTDCAKCFFQSLGEWWELWNEHPEIYSVAEEQEQNTGHTFRSPGRDSWPASLKSLREMFEQGAIPKSVREQDLFSTYRCRECSM